MLQFSHVIQSLIRTLFNYASKLSNYLIWGLFLLQTFCSHIVCYRPSKEPHRVRGERVLKILMAGTELDFNEICFWQNYEQKFYSY